jgi:hypothetical protein
VPVSAVRGLGRSSHVRGGIIADDFVFRGISAANRLSEFRDHGPGPGAAGTTWTARARAAPARRQATPN